MRLTGRSVVQVLSFKLQGLRLIEANIHLETPLTVYFLFFAILSQGMESEEMIKKT